MIKDIIKNNDIDSIINLLNTKGKIYTLSLFGEVLDKRSYFNMTPQGKIKLKDINYILPIFALENDSMILSEKILELSDLKERTKIKKINRHSNGVMNKLKENFMKSMSNGNVEFAKEFGKEIFLRDEDEFYRLISIFSLTGNIKSLKTLMTLSFIELVEKYKKENITDEILYLLIAFLSKYRDIYYDIDYHRNNLEQSLTIGTIYEKIISDKNLMESRKGLELLSYLMLIKKVDIENRRLYINIVDYELCKKNKSAKLNENEKLLLEKLFVKLGE